jgi:(S)-ureidoglycine aminohydrolase
MPDQMQHLGYTRSSYQADHLLHTPDAFVRAPLPGMQKATAVVHIAPARGASFTEYTAEFESGGSLGPATGQRFVFVIDGELVVGDRHLEAGGYVYLPSGCDIRVAARGAARAAVIEKSYLALSGIAAPAMFTGNERRTSSKPLGDDPALQVRVLIPEDAAFDFAVNTMTFQPGATLPMVEIHVMEHGLLMLEGSGIYRLGGQWYPVAAGDFIWMAPYCPQWFGALGKTAAKYLIYKDWNR